jgi:hypothetical protein
MDKNTGILNYFYKRFIEEKKIVSVNKKQKLYSKKNSVTKIEITFQDRDKTTYVLKEYTGSDRCSKSNNENFFYDVLKNCDLKIPGVFYRKEALLVMEFLGDKTLLDYITVMEQENDRIPFDGCSDPESFAGKYRPLADACYYMNAFNKKLHKIYDKSYVLNDMNLRNFLIPGGEIHRVDFEDCGEGLVEEDFGKFIAFLVTYRPAFTSWKLGISECIKTLCRFSLKLDHGKINFELDREIERMKKRRMH